MWHPPIHGALRDTTLAVVHDVAERFLDPERVESIANQATAEFKPAYPQTWIPRSLPYGNAGLVLLFGQLDRAFPGKGWDLVAHDHLAYAVGSLERFPFPGQPLALYSGVTGLAFAAHEISQQGRRYTRLLSDLDNMIVDSVASWSADIKQHPRQMAFGEYDVISGPSGFGSYLLLRGQKPRVSEALNTIVNHLLLMGNRQPDAPGYFIDAEDLPTDRHRSMFPDGCIDCGLAHGVPGPLAFLSLLHLQRLFDQQYLDVVPTIHALVRWLIAQRCDDVWGMNWPTAVGRQGVETTCLPARAAWCYGSPGISVSLLLAGKALDDAELVMLANDALIAVSRRPLDAQGIPSPILCHGTAGLLQIVQRINNSQMSDELCTFAESLTQRILDCYDSQSATGFHNIDPDGRLIPNPGFLEGSAGIALALLAVTTDAEPSWDRALLLS